MDDIGNERIIINFVLSLEGTELYPHFNRLGFKVINKKLFATYSSEEKNINIFLSPIEQSIFCKMNVGIYPIPNKWGSKGSTTFEINSVPMVIIKEALLSAYNNVLFSKKRK